MLSCELSLCNAFKSSTHSKRKSQNTNSQAQQSTTKGLKVICRATRSKIVFKSQTISFSTRGGSRSEFFSSHCCEYDSHSVWLICERVTCTRENFLALSIDAKHKKTLSFCSQKCWRQFIVTTRMTANFYYFYHCALFTDFFPFVFLYYHHYFFIEKFL